MPTAQQIIFGLLIPMAAAFLPALIVSWIEPGASWGALLGMLAGFVLALHGVYGQWPELHPSDTGPRAVLVAIPIGIVAIGLSYKKVPSFIRFLEWIAAPTAAAWFLLSTLSPGKLSTQELWTWIGGVTGTAIFCTLILEWLNKRDKSVGMTFTLGPVLAGAAVLILFNGNTYLGLLTASLATMALGWCVAELIARKKSLGRGPTVLAISLGAALLARGFLTSDTMTILEVSLVGGGIVAGALAEIVLPKSWNGWKQEIVRLILVAIPVGVAVGLAFVQFKKDAAGEI